MVSLGVIMRDVFCQRALQRAFTKQNELGETPVFDGAHPPFGERIGVSLQMRRMPTLKVDVSE